MGKILKLVCTLCGAEYQEEENVLTCKHCGQQGILDVVYDYEKAKAELNRDTLLENRELSHWRYIALMPVEADNRRPPLRVGWSPLYRCESLSSTIGLSSLYIKDDGQNPTNSLKDRASSVGVARALRRGAKAITCASTGNAATSLAGNAASVGLRTFIFVPERVPEAKLAQLLVFGADVFVVKGSYEDAFELSMKSASSFGWYNRNSGINPYLVEGKKTVAFEICEQLAWQLPDWVAISVGDGCSIAGVWKGLKEFYNLGLISHLPHLLGVQAEGSAPIYTVWETGMEELEPVVPQTLADSIAVGTPRNWRKALRAVCESDGKFVKVTDDEILSAMRLLGSKCGVFAEPAAAASIAGVFTARRQGILSSHSSVIAIITGNGLKDTHSAIKACKGKAHFIRPSFNEIENIIQKDSKNFLTEDT
ncbi:threonine synthase [Candidatus Sumerlaeota bacterium]|nr:threonine synthase [Candidatus Sumerlaeota bacterium]